MIRAKEIRVVDEDAGQLGIMTPEQALALARSRELDLVEVAPGQSPGMQDHGFRQVSVSEKQTRP